MVAVTAKPGWRRVSSEVRTGGSRVARLCSGFCKGVKFLSGRSSDLSGGSGQSGEGIDGGKVRRRAALDLGKTTGSNIV